LNEYLGKEIPKDKESKNTFIIFQSEQAFVCDFIEELL